MFVVLEHTVPNGEGAAVHWDFMLEVPGQERLATWRLARNPLETTDDIPATRLADHRRAYLDYEGELSGGRGRVRRVEQGGATLERLSGAELVASLAGTRLCGRFEITATPDGELVFRAARRPEGC